MRKSLRNFLVILFLFNISAEMKSQVFKDLFPEAPAPWEKEGPVRYYDSNTLYEYIDGGAELFLSYDFIRAASRKYTSATQPEIVADIFYMGTAANAFGVFCHVREETSYSYGQGAQVYDDAIVFWKGPYYISVMAYDITPEVKQWLPAIAKSINEKITETGPLPEVISLLPEAGLDKNSILYFHHYIWQNALGFLADSNFLSIHTGVDAVLANYFFTEDKQTVLLVDYHNSEDAGNSLKNFTKVFHLPLQNPVVLQIGDKTWMGAIRNGSRLVLVFQGKNRENTEQLIQYFQSGKP